MNRLDADASEACNLAVGHPLLAHGLDMQLRPLRGDERILGLDDFIEVAAASLRMAVISEPHSRRTKTVAPFRRERVGRDLLVAISLAFDESRGITHYCADPPVFAHASKQGG